MPEDGESRYNADVMQWEQFHDPPGTWEPVQADFGPLDRPVDDLRLNDAGRDDVAR